MSRLFQRREVMLLGGAALASSGLPRPTSARSCGSSKTLGGVAAEAGVTFGCSIDVDVLSDQPYVELILREARILTTDLAFKLPFIYPERGRFDFDRADRMVDFARRNKIPLRAHTLFWDLSNPDWITKLSTTERRYEFDRIIDTIVARYHGRLHSWDLVNEPFWPGFGEPGGFRKGTWYDALGKEFVFRAFRRASAIDPGAKHVLNCDMTERNDDIGRAVRRSVLELVDDMQQKGLRLDALGLQGHVDPGLPYDIAAYEDFLWQLAERKVPIYITELDVLDLTLDKDPNRRDKDIAKWYSRYLGSVLKIPTVELIITWQLADSKSWYGGDWYRSATPAMPRDWQTRPLPFDSSLAKKPAWHAMTAAFCIAGNSRAQRNRQRR